jgi:cytochrome P450/NADPH-cytochrome P450 reductase
MPAFGPSSLRAMFNGMYDIASQLAMKWARHGKNTPITVTEDFTRMTLDTIALCAMDFRFNSYYKDDLHPFVAAMSGFLTETGNRARRLPLPSFFYRGKDRKFFSDIHVLRKTANEVLRERKAEGNLDTRKDLLSAMLNGVDPKTGQKMSDQSILDNLVTFLIAGHETTSGLLSFAFYFLMTHPEAYRKAQQEVDEVCGKGPIKFEHMSKLSYVAAVSYYRNSKIWDDSGSQCL